MYLIVDVELLRDWFLEHKRIFAWRDFPSAYQVLVSEVMLQQTQASRVVGYYHSWMARFPTIFSLASADETEVMKCWEGLGYYSRARALHGAAIEIVRRFNGILPDDKETLLSIKGIGPYTVGAILSFAFRKKAPAVDANVVRVLARYYQVAGDIRKQKTKELLYDHAERVLPENRPWEITEALIELGALVCQKRPNCAECPIQKGCMSFRHKTTQEFPVNGASVRYEALFREVLVIVSEDNKLLVRQGQKGRPCAGLYEFTYFDSTPGGIDEQELEARFLQKFGAKIQYRQCLAEQAHSFTKYRVTLYPKLYSMNKTCLQGFEWCSVEEAGRLTFNSGHKRVLTDVLQNLSFL